VADAQFPGRLTALTELQLPVEILTTDFSSVKDCVGLLDLQLDLQLLMSGGFWPPAATKWWVAQGADPLVQLTRLTRLYMELEDPVPADGAFYGVLRQLTGLRGVGAYSWDAGFLPVLRSLTNVTSVYGGWDFGDDVDFSGLVCPHIREVGGVYCDAPFRAFPNLVCLSLYGAGSLGELSHCCTSLQRLELCGKPTVANTITTAMAGGPDGGVSAVRSLAHLQCLTHLELSVANDAQLVAFMNEATAVGTPQLRFLHVQGNCSLFALMQLQSVCHGLKELNVTFSFHPMARDSFSVEAVRAWLVSLAAVPKVSLVLCLEQQHNVVDAARQWAGQHKLPLPAVLKVTVAPLCGSTILFSKPV
jgi:hypothetical protein